MRRPLLATLFVLAVSTPAFADATVFLGSTMTPANRAAKGIAIGVGLLVVGFEFEFADTGETLLEAAPSLRTGMGNVLFQTPVFIAGFQPYFTTGAGLFRESLLDESETSLGGNAGGGVKVKLAGPLRARFDYRIFRLRGEPLHDVVLRLYVGANLAF